MLSEGAGRFSLILSINSGAKELEIGLIFTVFKRSCIRIITERKILLKTCTLSSWAFVFQIEAASSPPLPQLQLGSGDRVNPIRTLVACFPSGGYSEQGHMRSIFEVFPGKTVH